MKPLTVGSLFSGIGGLDLGLERAGMRVVWQSEIDPYASRVLKKHWPDVPNLGDITKIQELPYVDLICGGFPCQDISVAGKRVGITGERSGLWREFRRIIRMVRPRWVIVENTPGILSRGMDVVLGDLAASGYDAEWSVLPGCALGSSHSRARMFFVAYPACGLPRQLRRIECKSESEARGDVHWPEGEPGIPRELDGVPDRMDRCQCVGNAVVPQVAEWIGHRIVEAHAKGPPQ